MQRFITVIGIATAAAITTGFLTACATGGSASHSDSTTKAASKSERADRADDLFALFDANGDGFITKAEMETGLRSASNVEPNPNLIMALDGKPAKKKKPAKTTRALSDAQIRRAVEQAFKSSDKGLEDRISKEEFRKVVSERPASEADDPWAPFM